MELYRSLEDLEPDQNNFIATGNFDGLHLGHQSIIKKLRELAKPVDGKVTLVSFHPHPRLVLKKQAAAKIEHLTTIEEKTALLEKFGVDKFILIPFTESFSKLTSEAFVSEILCGKIGMKGIVIGRDHTFGRGGKGGFDTLQALAPTCGFQVRQADDFSLNGNSVSSTLIRSCLSNGEIEAANTFLGFNYPVFGRVTHGDGRGRTIGFPTANVELGDDKLLPRRGVYCVSLELEGSEHFGMANIGVKPTFDGEKETLEAHIFDFDADIYTKGIKLFFHKRLRDEKKFTGVKELIKQLEIDKNDSLRFFSAVRHK